MIKSMTGYGRGKYEKDGREYTVEIKTVNHRYNDISVKMPRCLNFLEDTLRQYVGKIISRGKTDIFINMVNLSENGRDIKIDKELAGIYIREIEALVNTYNIPNDLTATSIVKLPDMVILQNEEDENLYWQELKEALDLALNNIVSAREKEGERLRLDVENRLEDIKKNVKEIESKSAGLLDEYKTRLENRIKELNATNIIDENRLGIEIVLYADKSSVCEEITRLNSHIISLKEMLNSDTPIGKKLDFLVQEMNREINTIGSKANSLDITKYVVETKNEIENIREQIQNIE
jgi:uncharacterized protein (TIGR00255 family)